MIRKESLKYRDVCEYEGKFYDWKAGEHLLQKGMVVDEMFHPLEHDIVFEKDLQVTLRDGVKILTDVYLPADTDEPLPAIIAWSPYGKNSGNADLVRKHLEFLDTPAGTVAYRLKNYAGRDDWRDIIVILNANKSDVEVAIPNGDYTIVCSDGCINEEGMGILQGEKAVVSPQSALILHNTKLR